VQSPVVLHARYGDFDWTIANVKSNQTVEACAGQKTGAASAQLWLSCGSSWPLVRPQGLTFPLPGGPTPRQRQLVGPMKGPDSRCASWMRRSLDPLTSESLRQPPTRGPLSCPAAAFFRLSLTSASTPAEGGCKSLEASLVTRPRQHSPAATSEASWPATLGWSGLMSCPALLFHSGLT
jgi:hypothetical protein